MELQTLCRALATGGCLAATCALAAPPAFRVVDLGARPPGIRVQGNAINAAGQIAGSVLTHDAVTHGVVSGPEGRGRVILGTLGGTWTSPAALNASGRVVGLSALVGNDHPHPFVTADNGVDLVDLGTFGGDQGYATGINAGGWIVGAAQGSDLYMHPFMAGPGDLTLHDLGTLGGRFAAAYGINDAGQVVGDSDTAEGRQQAFITDAGGTNMRAINKPHLISSTAWAVNASGQVVGSAIDWDGSDRAFITGPNGADMSLFPRRSIKVLSSTLVAINAAGQAVGSEYLESREVSVAVMTDNVRHVLVPLDNVTTLPPGVSLEWAEGINDAGEIVANGDDRHAYLLIPI